MRTFLLFLTLVVSLPLTAQKSKNGDTLPQGFFDTSRIEITSKISFPFCSKLYPLPRDCKGNLPPNCCGYSTSLNNNTKFLEYGFVSCNNGSNLTWYYYGSIESAKAGIENILPQYKKQQKNFTLKKIKCMVMNKETDAYLLEMEPLHGYKTYHLLTCGSYNGYTFSLEYRSINPITTNENIQPFIRPILRLED
jgi:hypothetical protein